MSLIQRIADRLRTISLAMVIEQILTLIRFVVMAIAGFSINFGLTVLLHEKAGWPEQASFACGLIVVFVFNFVVFQRFVFKAAGGDKRQQLKRFFWTSVIFRSSEYVAFLIVIEQFEVDYRFAVIGILGLSMLSKFVIYRLFVFRDDGKPAEEIGQP